MLFAIFTECMDQSRVRKGAQSRAAASEARRVWLGRSSWAERAGAEGALGGREGGRVRGRKVLHNLSWGFVYWPALV